MPMKWTKDTATITPEANPKRAFYRRTGMSFLIRKTNPDPSIVPRKGMRRPIIIVEFIILSLPA